MNIPFSGTFDAKQIRQAYALHMAALNRILFGVISLQVLAIVLVFLMRIRAGLEPLLLPLLFMLLLLLYLLWLPRRLVRQTLAGPLGRGPLSGQFTEAGVAWQGAGFETTLTWDALSHYQATDQLLLIYQNRSAFTPFPRAFFAEADWLALLDVVQIRLPHQSANKRYWLVRVLAILLVIIFLIALMLALQP